MTANGLRAVRARLDLTTGHVLFATLYKNLRQVEQEEPRNKALLDAFQVVALSMAGISVFLRSQRQSRAEICLSFPFFFEFGLANDEDKS